MYKQVAVETEQQYRFAIGHKDVKDIIISIDCFSDAKIPIYVKEIKESGKRPILRLERITRDYNPSYKKYIEDENVYGSNKETSHPPNPFRQQMRGLFISLASCHFRLCKMIAFTLFCNSYPFAV